MMTEDEDKLRARELLSAVVGNVVAVPVVLGFVALGAGVLAGRAVLDVVGQSLRRSPRQNGSRDRPAQAG
jgi:hypothetical protein